MGSRRRKVTSCEEKGYVGRFTGTEKSSVVGGEKAANLIAVEAALGKTAAKWSIHSERIEGVAKELFCLIGGLDSYISSVSNASGPIMQAIKDKMDNTDWDALHKEGKTMFSYGPEMSTDPTEAQTIKMFTFMKGAKRALEIGMFTGYGAAAIIEALPTDGECVSLDIDPFLKEWVGEVMAKFQKVRSILLLLGQLSTRWQHCPQTKSLTLCLLMPTSQNTSAMLRFCLSATSLPMMQ